MKMDGEAATSMSTSQKCKGMDIICLDLVSDDNDDGDDIKVLKVLPPAQMMDSDTGTIQFKCQLCSLEITNGSAELITHHFNKEHGTEDIHIVLAVRGEVLFERTNHKPQSATPTCGTSTCNEIAVIGYKRGSGNKQKSPSHKELFDSNADSAQRKFMNI